MRKPHVLSLSVPKSCTFSSASVHRKNSAHGSAEPWKIDAQITFVLLRKKKAGELNKTYRSKDYATNVLTFDYQIEPVVEADLVICVPVLEKESKDQNKTLEEHMAHLLVHGTLHAQGYDHMDDEEAEVMEQRETDVLVDLGFDVPYPDRNYTPQPLA